ncbi:hypothetical protein [Pusillimonas sp. ANT_WB101]|uniref:hypothetical protein n=1 Tax=Pusillimonas sp. ANT_WB101 TaxID=2597356 RepID=UPI0011ED4C55|nr:hypothetical protein [Pusillimonas sp. ANT_WB101]KAA0889950.1 hypothetical protein FQ179_16480 [Pusillimonas sp. ANT_WB101]
MLKLLEKFVVHDKIKLIFDHLRNLLMCTLLLAAGHFQLENPVGVFADSTLQRFLGYGVVGIALALIVLNLLDGMSQLNKLRHPFIFKLGLIIVYVVVAIRVVVVTSTFRAS